MDTPSVKAPYTISVTVPSPLVAACSGTPAGSFTQLHGAKWYLFGLIMISVVCAENNPTFEDDGSLTWTYIQKVPIPAYLIAVVAGALKKATVGPRSSVWTEKELLDASVYEFSADTENYIKAGEDLTQIPYEWGTYDMVR
jgi:leukotriene-A4 hydrolase